MPRDLYDASPGFSYRPSYEGQFPSGTRQGRPFYKKQAKPVAKKETRYAYIVKDKKLGSHRTYSEADAIEVKRRFEAYGGNPIIVKKRVTLLG